MTADKRMENDLTSEFNAVRQELNAYLCRLVVRPPLAEDLLQTTYLRCLEAVERLPESGEGIRAWLFKVATHLAFDELRRHSHWRERMILDLRAATEADAALVERSKAMIGTPETKAIAREHLLACLACTLRNLPERKAAALLLKEVHGFTVGEAADVLEASPAQVKNWLQDARRDLEARYGATCALLSRQGVCHQCVELDGFFASGQGSPLPGDTSLAARLAIASELRSRPWGTWHRLIFGLIDDLT
jgi:RNA polymerase sigma-70 factor, ECF subfamily